MESGNRHWPRAASRVAPLARGSLLAYTCAVSLAPIKRWLRRYLTAETYRAAGHLALAATGFRRLHYSQFGEDIYLAALLDDAPAGVFVDVGAHDPRRLSNTYLLYRRGWRGINIDPLPGMKRRFDRVRPRDINLEVGASSRGGTLEYFVFNEPSCNTFSREVAMERNGQGGRALLRSLQIPMADLNELLAAHLPALSPSGRIDLMNVDVEGMEVEILANLDERYRPTVICAEDHDFHAESPEQSALFRLLGGRGYTLLAWIGPTLIFRARP